MNEILDLSSLQKSLHSLREANQIVRHTEWFNAQQKHIQNTLIAGLIQHFEFVYEISIKMLKRRLELDAASIDEIDQSNFRDLLRIAAEKGLISNVAAWFEYRKMRNITSHTYDEDKAKMICDVIEIFAQDADLLLQQLERHNV